MYCSMEGTARHHQSYVAYGISDRSLQLFHATVERFLNSLPTGILVQGI